MRRLWMAAWIAAACAGGHGAAVAQDAQPLSACIAALRKELHAFPDVKARTFDDLTRDAQDLRPVIERATRAQPEFEIPIWDYLARRVDAQRIADGRDVLQQEAAALEAIARRHGVDPATTVAVLGIETDFGRVAG